MSVPGLLPAVDVDGVSQPFFDAARDNRLLVQRCLQCGTAQLGSEICNHCFDARLEWVAASGKGVIHSFVVMHLSYHAAFVPPYRSAMVELEEGPRLPVPRRAARRSRWQRSRPCRQVSRHTRRSRPKR